MYGNPLLEKSIAIFLIVDSSPFYSPSELELLLSDLFIFFGFSGS